MGAVLQEPSERVIDRYAIYDQIAAGGMAVVHFGRLLGQAGFSRTVAIKRLHPQFASDPDFVAMFLDEAHLAVRVQHPNVVAPLDVVVEGGELLVIMDYVSGETLAQLIRQSLLDDVVSPSIIGSVMAGTLYGLHAAHEATGEDGAPLNIVHRDVSPQNIIVGVDGVARVLDFGVAKAAMRSHATKDGEIKGKIAYMAPEQLKAQPLDRRADVFAAGVVLWEALTGRRLFRGDDLGQTIERVLHGTITPPGELNASVNSALDAVVMRALERDPNRRFATAREFASAIEGATPLATPSQVADWVRRAGGRNLAQRIERVAAIESRSSSRLRVTARSPLHTPLGFESAALSAGLSDSIKAQLAAKARSADEIPTVRPAPEMIEVTPERLAPPAASSGVSKRLLAAVALLALGSGVVLSWWSRDNGAEPRAVESSLAQPASSAASASALATAPVESRADPPQPKPPASVGSPMIAAKSPVATAPSIRSAAVKATLSAPAVAAKARKATPPVTAGAGCSPPYVIDDKGIRRIKPGCM